MVLGLSDRFHSFAWKHMNIISNIVVTEKLREAITKEKKTNDTISAFIQWNCVAPNDYEPKRFFKLNTANTWVVLFMLCRSSCFSLHMWADGFSRIWTEYSTGDRHSISASFAPTLTELIAIGSCKWMHLSVMNMFLEYSLFDSFRSLLQTKFNLEWNGKKLDSIWNEPQRDKKNERKKTKQKPFVYNQLTLY